MRVLGNLCNKARLTLGALVSMVLVASLFPVAASADAYRVALIYPGTATDLSWSNAWYDGAEQAMAGNSEIQVESVEFGIPFF